MSTWAGNLIWLARDKANLSQRELAKRAGTSQPTIAAYEGGRKEPTFSTLVRIIRAAGLDLRTRIAPYDDHDEWIKRYEENLPAATRRRIREELEELRGLARRQAASA